MTTVRDLATPALLLHVDRFQANIRRMRHKLRGQGPCLTPHFKTLKSIDAFRAADFQPDDPLCVSTLHEAEYLLNAGWRNLTYTTALEFGKLERIAALLARGAKLKVIVDNVSVAARIGELAAQGHRWFTYLEVDCGAHRTGVPASDARAVEIAETLSRAANVDFLGIFTWAGHSYGAKNVQDIKIIAAEERRIALVARDLLADRGIACPEVSLGSTPTVLFAERFDGVSFVRAGVYSLFDRFQLGLGCCQPEDLALSVLTTVIRSDPQSRQLIVDAGFLALSSDAGAGLDYGAPATVEGRMLDEWRVSKLHQEHGFLTSTGSHNEAIPEMGSKLQIWPNHACSTAAAFDTYNVIRANGEVCAVWSRINGW